MWPVKSFFIACNVACGIANQYAKNSWWVFYKYFSFFTSAMHSRAPLGGAEAPLPLYVS